MTRELDGDSLRQDCKYSNRVVNDISGVSRSSDINARINRYKNYYAQLLITGKIYFWRTERAALISLWMRILSYQARTLRKRMFALTLWLRKCARSSIFFLTKSLHTKPNTFRIIVFITAHLFLNKCFLFSISRRKRLPDLFIFNPHDRNGSPLFAILTFAVQTFDEKPIFCSQYLAFLDEYSVCA